MKDDLFRLLNFVLFVYFVFKDFHLIVSRPSG
jgi:hypothetical protein